MRIVIVLGVNGASLSGGFRIVAGYADRLAARGHDVAIIAPGGAEPGGMWARIKHVAKRAQGKRQPAPPPYVRNRDVQFIIKPGVNRLDPEDFPDADVLIATWWETAEWIESIAGVAKVHFVQGLELFPYLPVERVTEVYRSSVRKIAVSDWLVSRLSQYCDPSLIDCVPNPVDPQEFDRMERAKSATPTVGFLYSVTPVKNSPLAIDVCRRLKAEFPEIRVVSFGSHQPRKADRMPKWVEYHLKPDAEKIAMLYGACDVWLFTSTEEGFGLPILEAMAAGTPVVATPAGAAPQIINDQNGVLVAGDAAELASAARKIMNFSPDTWRAASDAAKATAQNYDWEQATDRLETILRAILAGDANDHAAIFD